MKKLMLSTAIVAALAGAAWSQTAATDMFRTQAAEGDIRASDLIGMRIYSTETPVEGTSMNGMQDNWADIGEVNDVILSQDGKVEAVLVDIGGFLGIGERQVAVQMASLKMLRDDATSDDPDDFFLVLNANRAALESAPAYSMAGDAAMTQGTATTAQQGTAEGGLSDDQPPVAVNPDGTSNQGASTVSNDDGTAMTNGQAAPATTGDATTNAQAGTDAMEATGTEGAITTDGTTKTMTDGSAEVATATDARSPISRDGYSPLQGDALTAETLTAASVYDAQDKRIGEISDLVLDDSGKITQVVFDVGGFLGIGEKRVALPLADVTILKQTEGDDLRVYVPQSEEQLEQLQTYEG